MLSLSLSGTLATAPIAQVGGYSQISPNVIEINSISQISRNEPQNTLFLFDLDDTVFDSASMVGSRRWRRYIGDAAKAIDPNSNHNWHDIFSYALAKKNPMKAVEDQTSSFLVELKNSGYVVLGLTSRERRMWYSTAKEGVDALTIEQLSSIGVNFSSYEAEKQYPELTKDSEYDSGVFFCNLEPKGEYLQHILKGHSNYPSKIIFVDDKDTQVKSVANTLSKLGIPHASYLYTATNEKFNRFDAHIANIQLYYFYTGTILSDDEAKCVVEEDAKAKNGRNANYYLKEAMLLAEKSL